MGNAIAITMLGCGQTVIAEIGDLKYKVNVNTPDPILGSAGARINSRQLWLQRRYCMSFARYLGLARRAPAHGGDHAAVHK